MKKIACAVLALALVHCSASAARTVDLSASGAAKIRVYPQDPCAGC